MRPQPTRSKTNERGRFEEATGFEAARSIGPLQGGMAAPLWLGGYCSVVTLTPPVLRFTLTLASKGRLIR